MPDLTQEEAFNSVFNENSEEAPDNTEDENLQVDDSVSEEEQEINAENEANLGNAVDNNEEDDSEILPFEQEPLNYQELLEQAEREKEALRLEIETAKKRQSDTHKDWHEMNKRLKELESKVKVEEPESDPEELSLSELEEELPEYAPVIESAIERKYRELRERELSDKKAREEQQRQKEEAHYRMLEDAKYGHPNFRKEAQSPEFEQWALSDPNHAVFFNELAAEQEKDQFSPKVLQIKNSIMNRYKYDKKIKKAAEQRKKVNEKHQEAVLDMKTQVPRNQSNIINDNAPKSAYEEAEKGFLEVFQTK